MHSKCILISRSCFLIPSFGQPAVDSTSAVWATSCCNKSENFGTFCLRVWFQTGKEQCGFSSALVLTHLNTAVIQMKTKLKCALILLITLNESRRKCPAGAESCKLENAASHFWTMHCCHLHVCARNNRGFFCKQDRRRKKKQRRMPHDGVPVPQRQNSQNSQTFFSEKFALLVSTNIRSLRIWCQEAHCFCSVFRVYVGSQIVSALPHNSSTSRRVLLSREFYPDVSTPL